MDNLWLQKLAKNPDHSQWYVDRFRKLAADGADLGGEARMIDAMVPRRSRILDAGAGAGRVGGFLAAAGHDVVGVDLDPLLVAAAQEDYPGPRWLTGDLSELDLPGRFDVIVCAGNVMTFTAPDTRPEILRRMRAHLADAGRVVIGFGTDRGYQVPAFLADVQAGGLQPDVLLSTWDLRPYAEGSDFLVAVLSGC